MLYSSSSEYPDESIEEFILHIPPDSPMDFIRAVCVHRRSAGRFITSADFRRRYHELHGSPPLLGFLCSIVGDMQTARFMLMPATSDTVSKPLAHLSQCRAIHAHHGRVLLQCPGRAPSESVLMVWDPISDERRELPMPMPMPTWCHWDWNAAVLCASDGPCDHLDCQRGPFLVVFVDTNWPCARNLSISTYSSDSGTWSYKIFLVDPAAYASVSSLPCAHVGNALYFRLLRLKTSSTVLKYDLALRKVSEIQLPPTPIHWQPLVLTSTEDGDLGCATVHEFKLYVWSRKDGPQVDAGWTLSRVIDMEMLLQSNAILTSPRVLGFTHGMGVVFLRSRSVVFTVYLKEQNLKKVSEGKMIDNILPYMTFHFPVLRGLCTLDDQEHVPRLSDT